MPLFPSPLYRDHLADKERSPGKRLKVEHIIAKQKTIFTQALWKQNNKGQGCFSPSTSFLLHVALSSLREKSLLCSLPPVLALHHELPLTTACSKTSESRFQISSREAWSRPLFGEKPSRCRSLEASGDTPLCLSGVT